MSANRNLKDLVQGAAAGDERDFGVLVARYQDMAVGYAFSILGDFHRAEDAAQEAFLNAFSALKDLRDPNAFGAWLRRIVWKHCDRQLRVAALKTGPMEAARHASSTAPQPDQALEQSETQARIRDEIARLPAKEREATLLFYIAHHSHAEIADFLGITRAAVRNRVHAARGKLRERMIDMVEESLKAARPSRDSQFATRVKQLIAAAHAGDAAKTGELIAADPEIVTAEEEVPHWYNEKYQALHVACSEGHLDVVTRLVEAGADVHSVGKEGLTPLSLAAFSGNRDLVNYLMSRGAEIDICVAAQLGDFDKVKQFVDNDAEAVHTRGPEGARPLHYAATAEIAELLIQRGADVNAIDDYHRRGALNWQARNPEVVKVLREHDASIDDVFSAALAGDLAAVQTFLEKEPSLIEATPPENDMYATGTILHLATVGGHDDVVEYLVGRGADLFLKDGVFDATPKGWARYFEQDATAALLESLEEKHR